jgi:hypothetical protein
MKWLARLIFPRHNPDMRRKEMRVLAASLLGALILAALVGIAIFYFNGMHGWHTSRHAPETDKTKTEMLKY